MATDFDFDGSFNDDEEEDGPSAEFEEYEDEEEDDEGFDEEKPKRNPLRLIILVLIIVVLLCAVCAIIFNLGLIPGLGGSDPAPPPVTQEPEPTDVGQNPPPATEEPDPGETPATAEPTAGPTIIIVPTDEQTQPSDGETSEALNAQATDEAMPTEEPAPTADSTTEVEPTVEPVNPTATPVPGPTVTPKPTVIITVTAENCENNMPPIADAGGPYDSMRGKGHAVVNFDGSNSMDDDGQIVSYDWDFGDDSPPGSGKTVTHHYTGVGSYIATLGVTDNCGATGQNTVEVTVVGPTPPAVSPTPPAVSPTPPTDTPDATVTPSPATPTPTPGEPTLGFCYRVQSGDTLSGLSWWFGVSWADLASVNGVPMHYFVIAGQGLFIPAEAIVPNGPNVYQSQPGDTMNNVAYHCGLTTATLAQANGLAPNATLTPGQHLVIPLWKP